MAFGKVGISLTVAGMVLLLASCSVNHQCLFDSDCGYLHICVQNVCRPWIPVQADGGRPDVTPGSA